MRKGCIIFFFLFAFSFVAALACSKAYAHHKQQVLGEATPASELLFPPVTSGPGLILPDSPLFFLDELKQSIRLLFAFSPEAKAKVYASVAAERLAELRIMLAKNNPQGINTALTLLTQEENFAAESLAEAHARGKNVSVLARGLNEEIKTQRAMLQSTEKQATGVLKLQFKAARKALKEAKVKVEDELEENELEREVNEDIRDQVAEQVEEAEDVVKKVERDVDELGKEASEAARKALKRREEAIKKAIEEKNEEIKKLEEKRLKQEKEKQEQLFKAQKEAVEQAKEAAKRAREAAKRFEKAKKAVEDITNQPVGSGSSGGSSGGSSSGDSGKSGSGEKE